MLLSLVICSLLFSGSLLADPRSHRSNKAGLVRTYLQKGKGKEGAVRLVGGSSRHEGNVEIKHLGRWGSVCDDEWDSREAEIVCRQLGFPSAIKATHSSAFGPALRKYWMDNIYCSGNEISLTQCRFDGWGQHDCNKQESAGVVCKALLKHELKIRLSGGRSRTEGRVELKLLRGWGSVCGDSWSLTEANVVCRHLKMGYALMATQKNYFFGAPQDLYMGSIQCRGNESLLAECKTNKNLEVACPGSNDSFAGVICSSASPDLVIDVNEIQRSSYLEDRPMYFLQCAMEENCLGSSAYRLQKENPSGWHLETRRLLRFTARVLNIGNQPFRPALPKHLWQFHQCHMHYHSMEVFATFDVLDGSKKVAEGHKASFCLEDNQCLPGTKPKFACANYGDQGISVNCTDIYKHNIDCQWVDVSDIEPGHYTFKVAINPEFKIPEMSFENNAAVCQMHYTETGVHIHDCFLTKP